MPGIRLNRAGASRNDQSSCHKKSRSWGSLGALLSSLALDVMRLPTALQVLQVSNPVPSPLRAAMADAPPPPRLQTPAKVARRGCPPPPTLAWDLRIHIGVSYPAPAVDKWGAQTASTKLPPAGVLTGVRKREKHSVSFPYKEANAQTDPRIILCLTALQHSRNKFAHQWVERRALACEMAAASLLDGREVQIRSCGQAS